jgi:hypothetical protein
MKTDTAMKNHGIIEKEVIVVQPAKENRRENKLFQHMSMMNFLLCVIDFWLNKNNFRAKSVHKLV